MLKQLQNDYKNVYKQQQQQNKMNIYIYIFGSSHPLTLLKNELLLPSKSDIQVGQKVDFVSQEKW